MLESVTYTPGSLDTATINANDPFSSATYTGGDEPIEEQVSFFLLNQDGSYILNQDGGKIIIGVGLIQDIVGTGIGAATYQTGDMV